jgi:hypothetical protein
VGNWLSVSLTVICGLFHMCTRGLNWVEGEQMEAIGCMCVY